MDVTAALDPALSAGGGENVLPDVEQRVAEVGIPEAGAQESAQESAQDSAQDSVQDSGSDSVQSAADPSGSNASKVTVLAPRSSRSSWHENWKAWQLYFEEYCEETMQGISILETMGRAERNRRLKKTEKELNESLLIPEDLHLYAWVATEEVARVR
ncbi:hypothetical protein F442_12319 [Phytophthora nicotianae P10297]|uniref:Uncharacterized protein n=1 Tax=Phytophthora nicotianae P10297 TaxID=1317064 RepID=W2Z030_PHYNI|nr:hypothetical protein F442_12319 [Phytophthora nicotianae P10297]